MGSHNVAVGLADQTHFANVPCSAFSIAICAGELIVLGKGSRIVQGEITPPMWCFGKHIMFSNSNGLIELDFR